MSDKVIFPRLEDFEATRQTLQWYSRVVTVVPRAYLEPHPRWWHISLKVRPDGMVTDKMPLPSGGNFWLEMNLRRHTALLVTSLGETWEFNMADGLTSNQFAEELLGAVADLGVTADYASKKYNNDDPREYNPAAAESFLTALVNADRIFKDHRATLVGEVSPVQLWPHGFDVSFEWFGTRVEKYEENGEVREYPSQLNLGFYPGDSASAYFYSNPWPFEAEQLLDKALPAGARWHTQGWQGTLLPYTELENDDNAEARLREYASTVFSVCSPTLLV